MPNGKFLKDDTKTDLQMSADFSLVVGLRQSTRALF